MAEGSGKLEKLTIQAYSDDKFTSAVKGYVFEAMINPESFTHDYGIDYTEVADQGGNASELQFNKMALETVNFKIVLDGTGVVPLIGENEGKDVPWMITQLKKTVYKFQGAKHQPYYSELLWGKTIFKGRLEKLSFEYKLFKSDGTPVRAVATLNFKGYLSKEMAEAYAKKSSPDMTHFVTIKEGDTLLGLCRQIYGKSKYYLNVAEHNKLTNFRYLVPGSKLSFPPLK